MQPNQRTHSQNADAPPFVLFFGADASVVTAAAQNIPPFAGAATSTTVLKGVLCGRNTSWISRLRVQFVGDVANVGGQTIQFAVLVNGIAIAGAALATPLASDAGVKVGSVDFTPTQLNEGDVVRVILTPSAILTAVLTLPSAVLS